jgi:hypothetical protein
MEDIKSTPEQLFAIMMKERIDVLEDTVRQLQEDVKDLTLKSNQSLFHLFTLTINTVDDDEPCQSLIDSCLDDILRYREVYQPSFAAWSISGNTMRIAMSLYQQTGAGQMKEMIKSDAYKIDNHNTLDFALFKELFYSDRVIEDDDNDAMFFPHPRYNIEYWWRHTTDFDTDVDLYPNMTEQPFTKSDNYGRSASVQQYLRDKIYVHKDWSDLLRLHYIF